MCSISLHCLPQPSLTALFLAYVTTDEPHPSIWGRLQPVRSRRKYRLVPPIERPLKIFITSWKPSSKPRSTLRCFLAISLSMATPARMSASVMSSNLQLRRMGPNTLRALQSETNLYSSKLLVMCELLLICSERNARRFISYVVAHNSDDPNSAVGDEGLSSHKSYYYIFS